ncbi:hypothetical protein [Pseudoalteromonas luteoviolacea]|uniref:Uncharacterized protein n=1 Tax=Pseudoalteromonas luteoviolacea S4060-1 TaxID=1365257 RepID=A0A167P2B7_9GAMM|nr:hypothetical protein [Pseudoalteromonas luteoviolacea]KZN69331.1 hypothetical protein N478_11905 [Pseudoalteromonas luteoviolacea S4060-1]
MNVYKLLFLISLGFVSKTYAVGVESAKIVSIQTYSNGTVAITTNRQHIGPSVCGSKAKYVMPASEKGVANTLSVLLTAKASSRPATIYLHDSVCSSGYPMITSVILE